MTETTDDKLLQQFFSDNRKEIEDNGFSRRVMHHLPDRYYRISQLWSLFCFTLAVVLFFVLGKRPFVVLRQPYLRRQRIE